MSTCVNLCTDEKKNNYIDTIDHCQNSIKILGWLIF